MQHLSELESINMAHNQGLTGTIPSNIFKLERLYELRLEYCSLYGKIPSFREPSSPLRILGLGNNLLTGEIPSSLLTISHFELMGLDDNALQGNIEAFRSLTSLTSLYLEDNLISGELTNDLLSALANLQELDLSMCGINSTLPEILFSHPSLSVIDLHGNKLYGSIPSIAGANTILSLLALHDNQLDSEIPSSISNLVALRCVSIAPLGLPVEPEV